GCTPVTRLSHRPVPPSPPPPPPPPPPRPRSHPLVASFPALLLPGCGNPAVNSFEPQPQCGYLGGGAPPPVTNWLLAVPGAGWRPAATTRTRHPRHPNAIRHVRPGWHDARMTRKTHYDHAALARTLDAQLYVISRSQALACGMTVGALRHRIRPDGPWRTLLPSVYLVDAKEPNVPQ